MDTKLEEAIDKEVENIVSVYGVRDVVAKIILLKGVTIYQDIEIDEFRQKGGK